MRCRWVEVAIGSALICCATWGQTLTSSEPNLATANPQVLLEVGVHDSKGKALKSLQPGDLEIYEDGVKQSLKALRLVGGREHREPQTPSSENYALSKIDLLCIVFHNTSLRTRKFATEAASQFLRNDLGPGTYIALFNLGGRLTPLAGFTNDRAKLIDVASRVAAGTAALGSSDAAAFSANSLIASVDGAGRDTPGFLSVSGGELSQLAVAGADVSTDAGANAVRAQAADDRRAFIGVEATRQMAQMRQMVQQLGTLPGRKTVLLLSPGLTLTGDTAELKSLLGLANRADLAIYAVDTNGMTQNSSAQGASNVLTRASNVGMSSRLGDDAPGQQTREQTTQFDSITDATRMANSQGGLRALAEGTGGFLIATNDLGKLFGRMLDEIGTRYEAVYERASGALDGRLHKIEVKMARPDLTVDSRTSYFALPKLKEAPLRDFEIAALTALSAKPQAHNFDFQAAAFRFRPEEKTSQYVMAFEIPASKLTLTPLPQGKESRLHMSVLGLVRNAQGAVVDRVSQDIATQIPEDRVSSLAGETISLERPITLAPGHYTLDAVAIDHEGHKSSSMSLAFDNPRQEGLSLSDIVLVQRMESATGKPDAADSLRLDTRRVVPQMNVGLPRNRVPYFYFVVYPDKSQAEKPELSLRFLVDGKVVSEQNTELPAQADSASVPVVLSGLSQPGRCELKVVVSQGDESAEQSLRYTVSAD